MTLNEFLIKGVDGETIAIRYQELRALVKEYRDLLKESGNLLNEVDINSGIHFSEECYKTVKKIDMLLDSTTDRYLPDSIYIPISTVSQPFNNIKNGRLFTLNIGECKFVYYKLPCANYASDGSPYNVLEIETYQLNLDESVRHYAPIFITDNFPVYPLTNSSINI